MLFIQYPACSTCQKAKKWLAEKGISINIRHIVDEAPTKAELTEWIHRSGLPVKKFFNTSGILYKELSLKDKLPSMSEREQIELLATNGKLIKRPLLISDTFVLVGFNIEEWTQTEEK
ncbi:ArsC family transcriptional regulator [Porphyromonas gingivicanis]|uniref:ArsC family transcriptional regulator n=1 Tax=Porphyromonas gingivicanis TaxID=266762 RepID=A0A0A2G1H2_9PORP|nr:arsenate reductase family protein [Porphyromonas gingivicanis]KGN97116.1 ArsC family transcriptional regulator [Porphyromonas gingivicanis]